MAIPICWLADYLFVELSVFCNMYDIAWKSIPDTFKCLYGQQGFYSYGSSIMRYRDFNTLRSRFRVPASATPNEIDRESVQKRVWVSEWAVTSSQESRNPSSSGNCCFSSGDECSSTKNKQNEVGEAMRSPSKQNENI